MLYDCLFEISYSTQTKFAELSKFIQDKEISYWCNGKSDVLIIEDFWNLSKLKVYLDSQFSQVELISDTSTSNPLILKLCECIYQPVDQIIEKYEHIEIPPIRFKAGTEIRRSAFSSSHVNKFIEELKRHPAIERVSLKKLAPIHFNQALYPLFLSLEDIITELTSRQLQSLLLAFKKGYYEIPRKIIMEDLARNLDIKRKTYEEHLRKGENTIMKYIIPIFQLMQKHQRKTAEFNKK